MSLLKKTKSLRLITYVFSLIPVPPLCMQDTWLEFFSPVRSMEARQGCLRSYSSAAATVTGLQPVRCQVDAERKQVAKWEEIQGGESALPWRGAFPSLCRGCWLRAGRLQHRLFCNLPYRYKARPEILRSHKCDSPAFSWGWLGCKICMRGCLQPFLVQQQMACDLLLIVKGKIRGSELGQDEGFCALLPSLWQCLGWQVLGEGPWQMGQAFGLFLGHSPSFTSWQLIDFLS